MLPFRLKPFLKEVIWGGDAIAAFKGIPAQSHAIGESWEVSAMPGAQSLIDSGELAGMPLGNACARFADKLLGKRIVDTFGTDFPILIKLIDAARDLSIQVHPDDSIAARYHSSRGKSEMWYIIDRKPGAKIIPGLKRSLTAAEFDRHLRNGTIMDDVAVCETHPGDVFYLPTGRIHAAGAGNFILEVQQASDITYRIHDYGRLGTDGRPRPLHHDMARIAVDLQALDDYRHPTDGCLLIDTPNFRVEKATLAPERLLHISHDAFAIIFPLDHQVTVAAANETLEIPKGHSCFIPANIDTDVSGEGDVLLITV